MPSLREHLDSPQFPDEEPLTEEDLAKPGLSVARFTGGWVAAGAPRWKAYAIYVASILGGILLALPAPGDLAIFGILGIGFIVFGIVGIVQTILDRRLFRP